MAAGKGRAINLGKTAVCMHVAIPRQGFGDGARLNFILNVEGHGSQIFINSIDAVCFVVSQSAGVTSIITLGDSVTCLKLYTPMEARNNNLPCLIIVFIVGVLILLRDYFACICIFVLFRIQKTSVSGFVISYLYM